MFGRYLPGLRITIDLLHDAEKKPIKSGALWLAMQERLIVQITDTENRIRKAVVGSKEYRVFGTLRCRTFGINAVEELALTNTESVSKVDQIFLRFEESLPVLQAVTITG